MASRMDRIGFLAELLELESLLVSVRASLVKDDFDTANLKLIQVHDKLNSLVRTSSRLTKAFEDDRLRTGNETGGK